MATQDGSEEVIIESETKPKETEPLGDDVEKSDKETTSQTEAGNATTQDSSFSNGDDADENLETVDLKIIWNKNKYDLKIPLDSTGAKLKERIHSLTGLPPAMQKVMYKGLLPEDKTLREIRVTTGAKIMVVGSTINDVLAVNTPKEVIQQEERLPTVPLAGMFNKSGGKVRLTFKLEQDQLWIGTKERTEKVPMGSIKNVLSEPIEDHEDYHMMAFQLGPTEASQYWVYWVPAQFVDAIKDTVLGKWQYF
ncbi:unnamed protein product [Menidia menidia]|uniref:(Atlantic silverside) hypothetical protein n=1 Tax=Menidia menidia TaxID=238744 RepID=A0A8S4AU72_9TELE|nr:unnamed protein product [Menidia menidia]